MFEQLCLVFLDADFQVRNVCMSKCGIKAAINSVAERIKLDIQSMVVAHPHDQACSVGFLYLSEKLNSFAASSRGFAGKNTGKAT
jgi:hypothetical protein